MKISDNLFDLTEQIRVRFLRFLSYTQTDTHTLNQRERERLEALYSTHFIIENVKKITNPSTRFFCDLQQDPLNKSQKIAKVLTVQKLNEEARAPRICNQPCENS